MDIQKIDTKTVKIFPKGGIDISTSIDLKDSLHSLMNEGFLSIIVDFSEVTSIDSSGLGKLLLFQKKLKERNGSLSIINVHAKYIINMFKMIKLDKVIKIEYSQRFDLLKEYVILEK